MQFPRKLALLGAFLLISGCHKTVTYTPPETPMPANTILISQMMRQLSERDPHIIEDLISGLDPANAKPGKKGPALFTPQLLDEFRKRILGKDWSGLDRFPGWTMPTITSTVGLVAHVAGSDSTLEDDSAAHPGAPPLSVDDQQVNRYIDLGPYPLAKGQTIALDQPSTLPAFTTDGLVSNVGEGITRGDGPNSLAPEHAESQRLADILNRLAANALEGAQPFGVTRSWAAVTAEASNGPGITGKPRTTSWTPEDVIRDLQASGHSVIVTDTRYFANFAHLHFNGQDVMAPFWINTTVPVPDGQGRNLLVPVTHAELEWHIRGPLINADISYYFGIDGKSEWRTMDTFDQPWVLKRDAHTYTGEQAIEATRLAHLLTIAYMHQHNAHPSLAFGGYFALGVCQDGVSVIEQKLTGQVTLYPNTADPSFFTDSRDAEINTLLLAIPKDRDSSNPDLARVFSSLPATPDAFGRFDAITIPGLADDLSVTYLAWKDGTLGRPKHPYFTAFRPLLFFFSAVFLGVFAAVKTRRFWEHKPMQRPKP